jgi:D-3-phosphoglycerate dehydrogenase
VARAGAGVNNVPVAEYGKQGIVVFNTPGANANAVKELVMAGMLLSARGIVPGMPMCSRSPISRIRPRCRPSLEKENPALPAEIKGKTLGIVGLGAIGSMVADMALAMGMKVVGFDPVLSIDAAWRLSNEVSRMENLQSLLARSDYVSLHVPAMDATRHMLNDDTLAVIKPGAVLLNFARDAIVDSAAVLRSLDAGRLGKYVCDFPEPALLGHPKNHCHAAHRRQHRGIRGKLCGDGRQPAGRLPGKRQHHQLGQLPEDRMERSPGTSRITFSNDNVSGVLGHVLSVLAEHKVNVVDMMNKSRGELAFNIVDVEKKPGEEVIDAIKAVERVIRVRVISGGSRSSGGARGSAHRAGCGCIEACVARQAGV